MSSVAIGVAVTSLVLYAWLVVKMLNPKTLALMGYQSRPRLPKPKVKPTSNPLINVLTVPKGVIANQCTRCLKVYLIHVPPPFNAEPTITGFVTIVVVSSKGYIDDGATINKPLLLSSITDNGTTSNEART